MYAAEREGEIGKVRGVKSAEKVRMIFCETEREKVVIRLLGPVSPVVVVIPNADLEQAR